VAAARQDLVQYAPTTVGPWVPDPAIAWPPTRPVRPDTGPDSRRRWWR
jgi:hypothetical protein